MLQKVVGRFAGANRVMPAEAEDTAPKDAPEAGVDDSPSRGKNRSIWSDSEYSSENASFRSSSAGDFSSPREDSPPTSGSRSSRQRATPNPLLLAFPVRSDEQPSSTQKGITDSDHAFIGDSRDESAERLKKGI